MPQHVQRNVPLSHHATLQVGGLAEYFSVVTSVTELRDAILWATREGLSWRVIGGGSNILFPDSPLKGLTIKIVIKGVESEETEKGIRLTLGAGENLDDVVVYTVEQGWWGLENLSSIPGTVGATPVQNVGAYGVEISDLLESVCVYDSHIDSLRTMTPIECAFTYRHSVFKETAGKHLVIVSVTLFLANTRGPLLSYRDLALYFHDQDVRMVTPGQVRAAVVTIRAGKFPDWHTVGTAGSFFKNPLLSREHFERLLKVYPLLPGHSAKEGTVKVSLGWILDHICGLRGVREGAVGTYGAQALVLVNHGGASAGDIHAFAKKIAESVFQKIAVVIEREVTEMNSEE